MHIFFSVGEPSGDLHAAKLVRELRRQNPNLRCTAFGGPLMAEAGCQIVYRLTDLAVMGFLRVVPLLWRFYSLVRQAGRYFEEQKPDAVVLVDFPGFNWWIARKARKHGIRVFYYLPPQLWAWAPWRVGKMRRFVDLVLCCLSFEEKWYRQRGVPAELVGHPFFDEVAERELDRQFLKTYQDSTLHSTKPAEKIVGVLPGSRKHEILHNFAVQIEIMNKLHAHDPQLRFLVACFKESQREQCAKMLSAARVNLPVELHVGRTSEIIELADVCHMVSGSVSLELLARTTPAVVLYRINRTNYWAGKLFMTCRYFSLPNLIADRPIMPEFLSAGDPTAAIEQTTAILHQWLTNPVERARVTGELAALRSQVAIPGATLRAATAILTRMADAQTTSPNCRSAA